MREFACTKGGFHDYENVRSRGIFDIRQDARRDIEGVEEAWLNCEGSRIYHAKVCIKCGHEVDEIKEKYDEEANYILGREKRQAIAQRIYRKAHEDEQLP